YGVSVDALMSQNGLSNANNIVVGSSLQISSSQEATSPATQSTSYTVQSGDTLSSIASVYGTTISHIESMNGLSDGNSIYPGQTLNI
ncbi:MAG: LysM peptidoglycan-binding domain-containing protein, partial [Streptococcaceae bacterium]|nr:LysM peptidoglycan-binding domain-containing protein [Streptococcaceae bacterium]